MIFLGKEHPLFSSYIKYNSLITSFTPTYHHPFYIGKKDLIEGEQYFIHPGLPLVDQNSNIEYIFNFEDQCALFYNMDNGNTYNKDYTNYWEKEYIKYTLEDPRCKKIICHINQMAQALPKLLQSSIIENKIHYLLPGIEDNTNNTIKKENDPFTILFTNSWSDWGKSFYLRGGHFLLNTFINLSQKYSNIKLILRTSLPDNFQENINKLNSDKIEIYNNKMFDQEIDTLYQKADIVVLPSIRVHSHSLLKAISYGLPIITTNGWGINEFVKHEYNGLILDKFENLSWHDDNLGCRENYSLLYDNSKLDQHVISQLYYYLEYLISNPDYLNYLSNNTKTLYKEKYTLDNWKQWII